MANWTGAVNGGTIVNGDVVTGNLTNNANYTLTQTAGGTLTVSGNYTITNNGVLAFNGTAVLRNTIKSSIAQPLLNSWGGIVNAGQAGTSITYTDLNSANIVISNTSATLPTLSNIKIESSTIAFKNTGGAGLTFTNCMWKNCTYLTYQSNAGITLVDCEGDNIPNTAYSCVMTITMTRYLHNGATTINYGTISPSNSLFINSGQMSNHADRPAVFENTIIKKSAGYMFRYFTGTFTNCDFAFTLTGPAIGNGGVLVNCSIFGCNGAGIDNYDTTADGQTSSTETPAQFSALTSAVSGMLATRNATFTPSAITESGLTDNGITLAWTSGTQLVKTNHRVRYGTSTATYTMIICCGNYWSNWDGLSLPMTTSPSIALVNLKSGTKYYYVCESYDWVTDSWVTSAEGDFTTTSTIPVISSQQLDSYTRTTAQNVIASCNVSNSPTTVIVELNGKAFKMINTTGTTYSVTIPCIKINGIDVCSAVTVRFVATSASGGVQAVAASNLTVTYGVL